jgi:hypothetical protein
VENVCTIPSVSTPPGLGLFFSDYAGKISVTISWRSGSLTQDEMASVRASVLTDLAG